MSIDVLVNWIEPDGMVVCTNGPTAVPIGTTFTSICKTRIEEALPSFTTVELGVAAHVALTLDEVIAFRNALSEFPAGYSAGLRLRGDGLQVLASLVECKEHREFVYLRTE